MVCKGKASQAKPVGPVGWRVCWMLWLLALTLTAHAGGPRWVTGTVSFDGPDRLVTWGYGRVAYYTDQGPLSSSVDNATANALVAAAAETWDGIPYATLNIYSAGTLDEDVSGSNTVAGASGIVFPTDVQSIYTAKPLAVIYDADGAITELLLGQGASDPMECRQNAVTESVDNIVSAPRIVHALLILNGRCTGTPEQLLEMKYQLIRKFGRVAGLDWSQANDNMFTGSPQPTLAEAMNWPIMHPIDIICGPYAYQCMPNPFQLRLDDRAAVGRVYDVDRYNIAYYPGKLETGIATIGISGKLLFPDGQPMEGVNVVARFELPYYQPGDFPEVLASSVTGARYRGNVGNPVTGYTDAAGNSPAIFGSPDTEEEGAFTFLGMEETLPSSYSSENVVFDIEPINSLYTGQYSVGPYTVNQVQPSGHFEYTQGVVAAGAGFYEVWTVLDAAQASSAPVDGPEASPAPVPPSGWWTDRLNGYGHTGWYSLNVQANRTLTIETIALDETGASTAAKAMPVIGVWNATDALGTPPAAGTPAFNGAGVGRTTLAVSTTTAEGIRIAVSDQRGDGRPDFLYRARVLYADSLSPVQVGANGGLMTITGIGFRTGIAVTVGDVPAQVESVTPNQIVVQTPPRSALKAAGAGGVDVTVRDLGTGGSTTIAGALSYTAGGTPVTTDPLIVISGSSQSLGVTDTLTPVTLEVTDGAGHGMPGVLVHLYQTVTGYQPPCPAHGRCPQQPLLGTANTATLSDANGQVVVDPLQIADRAITLNIVATAMANAPGMVHLVLAKH